MLGELILPAKSKQLFLARGDFTQSLFQPLSDLGGTNPFETHCYEDVYLTANSVIFFRSFWPRNERVDQDSAKPRLNIPTHKDYLSNGSFQVCNA